jgi:hypothetical protein
LHDLLERHLPGVDHQQRGSSYIGIDLENPIVFDQFLFETPFETDAAVQCRKLQPGTAWQVAPYSANQGLILKDCVC